MSQIVERISSELQSAYSSKLAAINQAKSLRIIASDIYTEEDRFIYELLQNAVDSFADTDRQELKVKISLCGDYLNFMHNGAAFSESDVEGICGIGNGTKVNDSKKIGYKGIGFKSVFAHSDRVVIKSGEHCFAFDGIYWKQKVDYLMPWQIIPLPSDIPAGQEYDPSFDVCTYIQLKKCGSMYATITRLLSNSSFLLFLGCKNASIVFVKDHDVVTSVKKTTEGDRVLLHKDDSVESRWMVHSILPGDAMIPDEIRQVIVEDENTPGKLKEASSFDLSFAINIDDYGRIIPLKESVVYTYLPTSVSMGFPFLVNSNFIADAGRQQLHKNSEWNKFLVSRIPHEYLKWVASFASRNENYYKVLPLPIESTSSLEVVFNKSLEESLQEVRFIPAKDGHSKKVSEVFVDKIDFSGHFSPSVIVEHINRKYSKDFDQDSGISSKGITVWRKYGVFIFEKECLKGLFEDEAVFSNISASEDVSLIRFLYNYYSEAKTEQEELLESLSASSFILTKDNNHKQPCLVYFPDEDFSEFELIKNEPILHNDVYSVIKKDPNLVKWLEKLGLKYLSYTSIIENTIAQRGYVTKENAIHVGALLYKVFKGEDFFEKIEWRKLRNIGFKTQSGTVCFPDRLYMPKVYNPSLDISGTCDDDIFVSEEYSSVGDPNIWHVILSKFKVSDKLVLTGMQYEDTELYKLVSPSCKTKLQEAVNEIRYKLNYHSVYGFDLEYYPGILISSNHDFLSDAFSQILCEPYCADDNTVLLEYRWSVWEQEQIRGGLWKKKFEGFSPRMCIMKESQLFPASDGTTDVASAIFLNTPTIKRLAGKYLPVLDVSCEIDASWINLLPFKKDLDLDDLLLILTKIAEDVDNAQENQQRIIDIYQRIIDIYDIRVEEIKIKIEDWGKENTILSTELSFISPCELSYITVDGFKSTRSPFFGKKVVDSGMIELLHIMGVQVVTPDNIKTAIIGANEQQAIPTRLKSVLPALALIKTESHSDFETAKKELLSIVDNSHFYQCESIQITFGEGNNCVTRNTFATEGKFYYTSSLRAATIEPLLSPLCKFLDLEGRERELFILLIELDMEGIRENLKEKGYDVECLEHNNIPLPSLLGLVSSSVAEENEDLKRRIAELESLLSGADGTIRGDSVPELEKKKRIEAQLEAQKYLKTMKPGWEFPAGYGERDDDGEPYCDTRVCAHTPDGEKFIVLKSHKVQSAPFKITVMEWDYISDYQAKIFIYTGSDIKEIDPEDLVRNQSTVSISFSTKNLDVEEKIHDFAQAMHYFKELHFDFESFDLSSRATSIRGLYNILGGEQMVTTDFDL